MHYGSCLYLLLSLTHSGIPCQRSLSHQETYYYLQISEGFIAEDAFEAVHSLQELIGSQRAHYYASRVLMTLSIPSVLLLLWRFYAFTLKPILRPQEP